MKRAFTSIAQAMAIIAAATGIAAAGTVTYTKGQGLIADGFGGYDLQTELCGVENGADADGPYMLWVFTASGATNVVLHSPNGDQAMTRMSNGSWKAVTGWMPPTSLPGNVSVTFDGKVKNPQLTISHGCRPYDKIGAWCSPGYWGHATQGAWDLIARSSAETFNTTVYQGFYGATFASDPTLNTVLTATGGTYKGPGVPGADARTQSPNPALNAFNAAGAYLTDQIPGYTYDPALLTQDESNTCPIDHFGNFKNQ